jgi:hypothetical protein
LEVPTVGVGFETVRVTSPTGRVISASKLVEFRTVARTVWPATCTAAPVRNPEPLIATGVSFPAKMLEGVIEVRTGAGFWIVIGITFEIPADGDGFWTVIPTAPAAARSDARIEAVNCVELTNCVTRLTPFR